MTLARIILLLSVASTYAWTHEPLEDENTRNSSTVSKIEAGENGLICFPGITSFSINGSSPEYYRCPGKDLAPMLTRCASGQLYNPEKQKCERPVSKDEPKDTSADSSEIDLENLEVADEAQQQIVQPTFGRKVFLGNPFDAKSEKLFSADFFWTNKVIQESKQVRNAYSSDLEIAAAKSTLDRMARLDISASLKLDFLGGLVSVEGSAKYYKETVESEDIANVVMEAEYLTKSETIPASTPLSDIQLCKRTDITHVVTGITYGMAAYFDFRKEIKSEESKESIEGELKVAIKSIPSIKVEAGVKVVLNGELKETSKNIRAKVRGDFILKVQPTSYVECIKVYKGLSAHLGPAPGYPNAVPKKMTLTPINRLCTGVTNILLKIQDAYIMEITRMLDEIEKVKIKAKTIQNKHLVQLYTSYKKLMNLFVAKTEEFELKIQSNIQKTLPLVRGGSKGEFDINKILQLYLTSPFKFQSAYTFLASREKEISVLKAILNPKTYQGTNVHLKTQATSGSIELVVFKKRKVLILNLNVLPIQTLVTKFVQGTPVDEEESWFNNFVTVATMGGQWRRFMEFANANKGDSNIGFIVEAFTSKDNVANVLAMKGSRVVSMNFDIPPTPPLIMAVGNDYNDVTLAIRRPTNTWVRKLLLRRTVYISEDIKGPTLTSELAFSTNNRYKIIGLKPNTKYVFSVAYQTVIGNTHYSKQTEPILTKPCSPPSNVHQTNRLMHSIKITWNRPLSIGTGVTITSYRYTLRTGSSVTKSGTAANTAVTLNGLQPATMYTISIKAVTFISHNGTRQESYSSPTNPFNVYTAPAPPSKPTVVASYTSARVSWTPPRIVPGARTERYVVKYTQIDTKGKNVRTQTMTTNQPSAIISGLAQGINYVASVKIVTSKGESVFSIPVSMKTKYKATELNKVQEALEANIARKIGTVSKKIINNYKTINSTYSTLNRRTISLRSRINSNKNTINSKYNALNRRISSNYNVIQQLEFCWAVARNGLRRNGVRMPKPVCSGRAITGHIEVLHNGVWGTICDDWFDNNDAKVVCRMLGWPHGRYSHSYRQSGVIKASKIWLDSVGCTGKEPSIFQCRHDSWGVHDCGHHEDVSVRCYR